MSEPSPPLMTSPVRCAVAAITNVSAPAPPFMLSPAAPPSMVSSPLPPVIELAPVPSVSVVETTTPAVPTSSIFSMPSAAMPAVAPVPLVSTPAVMRMVSVPLESVIVSVAPNWPAAV